MGKEEQSHGYGQKQGRVKRETEECCSRSCRGRWEKGICMQDRGTCWGQYETCLSGK